MKFRFYFTLFLFCSCFYAQAQSVNAAQILQSIQKLNILGSVLYIAAHPDDENTRLIAYLANDQLYRTSYLSLTRGDGGQNLIGDEQGIELGLIRTQELLSARRIDGGEQFFTRAYDFGYSKSPEETFTKWKKDSVLADVVWIIRKLQPDVIITRFPTTGEGGHGHHTASAIIANEAFNAAADPTKFKEQLRFVKPWRTKRILWNTFNFGGNNTTSSSQFNINVGGYNTLLGKSYGEIAAKSRSQHRSQGFGSAATIGNSYEYFINTGGNAPTINLFDGVEVSWKRIGKRGEVFQRAINDIEKQYNIQTPQNSIPALVALYKLLEKGGNDYWVVKKKQEVLQLIADCSGLYIDAYTSQPFAVQTGNFVVTTLVNDRLGGNTVLKSITLDGKEDVFDKVLRQNDNFSVDKKITVPLSKELTQPYWLKEKREEAMYQVADQQLIGTPDVQPAYIASFKIQIDGQVFTFEKPVRYRAIDPVKGEVYQPLSVVPAATIAASPNLLVFNKTDNRTQSLQTELHAYTNIDASITAGLVGIDYSGTQSGQVHLAMEQMQRYSFKVSDMHPPDEVYSVTAFANQKLNNDATSYHLSLKNIQYDHIPIIRYFYQDYVTVLNIHLKTVGKMIGYIPGAGDKVPSVLERMGYDVVVLDQATLSTANLSGYDAIITGVRAYNTNEWMVANYDKLMNYVKEGGNLIVQYNTNSNIGTVKSKIGPYDFTITRNRITDEHAKVTLLNPSHKLFNFPNKITNADFEHWTQERSIYHAGSWDNHFEPLLSMADPGEKADEGSLITTQYGKGYFTYTGLVFFRELPAGVPGAMRLMANLIALNKE